MLKAWEGVFTAVSRKREPSAGPCRYAPKLALWALETPPPDTNTKSTDESQCFLRGGRGWIRALSGRARLTAQAEGCQVVGRNLRPAQSCGLLASPRIHHPSHQEKPHPKQTFGLFRVGFGGRGWIRTTEVGDVRFTV